MAVDLGDQGSGNALPWLFGKLHTHVEKFQSPGLAPIKSLFYPLISSHNAWMASYGRVVKWINDLVFKNSIWSHIYSSFISQNARMKSIRGCCIGWYSELLKQRFAVIIISVAGFYSWSPSRSNCSDCHHKRISSAQSICNLVFFFLYSIL